MNPSPYNIHNTLKSAFIVLNTRIDNAKGYQDHSLDGVVGDDEKKIHLLAESFFYLGCRTHILLQFIVGEWLKYSVHLQIHWLASISKN